MKYQNWEIEHWKKLSDLHSLCSFCGKVKLRRIMLDPRNLMKVCFECFDTRDYQVERQNYG